MTTRPALRLALVLFAALSLGSAACGDSGGSDTGAEPVPCDWKTGDPCADDETCSYDEDGETVCFAKGDVAYGAVCSEDAPCAEGICLSINGTDSLCYELCDSEVACADGVACLELDAVPFQVCEIEDIYASCGLLDQDCDEGFGCYSVVDEETPICVPEAAAASGEACSAANDCLAGLVCVADACHDLCDTAATADCSGTEICAVYYDPDGAGYCTE